MSEVTVGVLHPGEMGASIGAAARCGGADVVWASAGRSESTHARAAAAGLRDVGTLQGLAKASDIVLAVCPPGAAADVAHAVATRGVGKCQRSRSECCTLERWGRASGRQLAAAA